PDLPCVFIIEADKVGSIRQSGHRELAAGFQIFKAHVRINHGVVGLETEPSIREPMLGCELKTINDRRLVVNMLVNIPQYQRVNICSPYPTAIRVDILRSRVRSDVRM